MIDGFDEVIDGVDEQSWIFIIDLFDSNLNIFFIGVAIFELVGIFECILKEFVDKFHSFFPVPFDGIIFIHFLKLAIIISKIFVCNNFI